MWKNLLLSLILYFTLTLLEVYKDESEHPTLHNNRMYKFALFQDLLVALSILKMLVIEGYSISGVVERIRSSGPVTHLYIATSVVLHGSLLFHEDTNHRVRLKPVPYDPPTLNEDQRELFLL